MFDSPQIAVVGVEVNDADVPFAMNIGEPGDVRVYKTVVAADMDVLLHNRTATSLPNSERAKEGASCWILRTFGQRSTDSSDRLSDRDYAIFPELSGGTRLLLDIPASHRKSIAADGDIKRRRGSKSSIVRRSSTVCNRFNRSPNLSAVDL